MDQRIINLYDEYTHKPLTRTEFFKRLTLLSGSTAAAMALLPLLENNYVHAAQTSEEDLQSLRKSIDATPEAVSALKAKGLSSSHVVAINIADGVLTIFARTA